MMFYAPARAMGLARDHARLLPTVLLALLFKFLFALYSQWDYLAGVFGRRSLYSVVASFIQSVSSLLSTALIFVPVAILIAWLYDRRGSAKLILQREFASVACIVFYCIAASDIVAFPIAYLLKSSGWLSVFSDWYAHVYIPMFERDYPKYAELVRPELHNTAVIAFFTLQLVSVPILAVLVTIGIRAAFRLSWIRSIVIIIGSTIVMSIGAAMFSSLIGTVLASPLILILMFLLLRGYVSEATRSHRARVSFKQNLEAATLNPADASAHYNLGLIHQQRNELDEAQRRFERATEIDNEDLDSHYQLGRIARQQNRYSDAIKHFEPVVEGNPTHAQHEVWREIGATYLAARQYEDALNAFERFLDHRQSDPEGLYLIGRTHAELGHTHEATLSMQACINAVETSPAYKYRTDKRWLNEAQAYIKGAR